MNNLTEQQINANVAELIGWTHGQVEKGSCGGWVCEYVWFMPGFNFPQTAKWIAENGNSRPPNYCNDLNACADFERAMYPGIRNDYITALWKVCGNEGNNPHFWSEWNFRAFYSIVHATARQRCEAFLKLNYVTLLTISNSAMRCQLSRGLIFV